VAALIAAPPAHVRASAALGLGYVGVVSMCLGFFAWYQGMALGGVASVGKLQLAQPALTLGWSALLLREQVNWLSGAAAAVVIAAAAIGRNARVGTTVRTRRRDNRPPGKTGVSACYDAIDPGRGNDQVRATM
jgi:drug/metabolite transporter (DMT)-like permease